MESNNNSFWKSFWGKLVAALTFISIVVTITGFTLKDCMSSCNTCTPISCAVDNETDDDETDIIKENDDDNEDLPTDEGIKQQIQQETGKVWIEDMNILQYDTNSSEYKYDVGVPLTDNVNNAYTHDLIFYHNTYFSYWKPGDQEIQYYLNNKYESFSFTLALDQKTRDAGWKVNVYVLADGEQLWSKEVAAGMIPEDVVLDISGTSILSIKCVTIPTEDSISGNTDLNVIFGNAYFQQSTDTNTIEGQVSYITDNTANKVWIEDISILQYDTNSSEYKYDVGVPLTDNVNNAYTHGLIFYHNTYFSYWKPGDQEIQYYLNNKYESFSFTLALDQKTRDAGWKVNVYVLADGEQLWSKEVAAGMIPEDVVLDISGASILSIKCVTIPTEDSISGNTDLNVIFGNAYLS